MQFTITGLTKAAILANEQSKVAGWITLGDSPEFSREENKSSMLK
jgi:hypothetical protein